MDEPSRLNPSLPLVIELEGHAFSHFTRKMYKPWDRRLASSLREASLFLCQRIYGARFAYLYSDCLTVVVQAREEIGISPWLDYDRHQVISVAASFLATSLLEKCQYQFDRSQLPLLPAFSAQAFQLSAQEISSHLIEKQHKSIEIALELKEDLGAEELRHRAEEREDEGVETCRTRGVALVRSFRAGENHRLKTWWEMEKNPPWFEEEKEWLTSHLALEKKRGNTLFVLLAPPAAGKSTACRQSPFDEMVRVNQDELGTVHKCLQKAHRGLREGKDVVIDRCNCSREERLMWVQLGKDLGAEVEAVRIPYSSIEELKERNRRRKGENRIPSDAVEMHHRRLQREPLEAEKEGFDNCRVFEPRPPGS